MKKSAVVFLAAALLLLAGTAAAESTITRTICQNGNCQTYTSTDSSSSGASTHIICINGVCTINGQPTSSSSTSSTSCTSSSSSTKPTSSTSSTTSSTSSTTSTTKASKDRCWYASGGRYYDSGERFIYFGYYWECDDGDWVKEERASGFCDGDECAHDGSCYYEGKELGEQGKTFRCENGYWNQVSSSSSSNKRCWYADGREYFDSGERLIYFGYYWLCSSGKWVKKERASDVCSSSRCPHEDDCFYDDEEVSTQGETYRCDNGYWRQVYSGERCWYASGGRYYDSGERFIYFGYYWECDDGDWVKEERASGFCDGDECAHDDSCYYETKELTEQGKTFRCENGYWKQVSSFTSSSGGSCWYADGKRYYNSGVRIIYFGYYWKCSSGKWTKQERASDFCSGDNCAHETSCYYEGKEITSQGDTFRCVDGRWIDATDTDDCASGECYYDGVCYASGKKRTDDYDREWRCDQGTWIRVGSSTADSCLFKDTWYSDGETTIDDYGVRWLCDDGSWEEY